MELDAGPGLFSRGMSAPELSVVCKSCGSEVSPYVTECPYCGNRLRKRAPELEREGDEIKVRQTRRQKRRQARERRRREGGERRLRAPALPAVGERPMATVSALLIAAVLLVVERAVPLFPWQVGAILGPVGDEPWRYVTAPFVYNDMGTLLVAGAGIAIFGSAVERRIGTLMTATLILACGTLGMLAAGAVHSAGLGELTAGGGNGVALGLLGAWLMLWRGESRTAFAEPLDVAAVSVAAAVLLLLPLVDSWADPVAGIVGGIVGLGLGWLAAARGAAED